MAKNRKLRPWVVFKTVVLSSAIVSRAVAAVIPSTPDHSGLVDDWRAVGNDLHGRQSDPAELNESVIDMIAAADLQRDLTAVVMATYAVIDVSQVAALDNHWTNVLTARGDGALVSQFLSLRSGISDFGSQGASVDGLIWKAHHQAGHTGGNCDGCNNGGGNDDEGCSPGQGWGANDDETNP